MRLRKHLDHPYVWETFFDPENPNEYPNQVEAEEDDLWESLAKSPEQQIAGIITQNWNLDALCSVINDYGLDINDQLEGQEEREARFAAWEMVFYCLDEKFSSLFINTLV